MNRSDILNKKVAINSAIKSLQIHKAITLIGELQDETQSAKYSTELENIKLEHSYLVKYFSNGINDNQRGSIYGKFASQLYYITDKIICDELTKNEFSVYYSQKRVQKKKSITLAELLAQYDAQLSKIELVESGESPISSNLPIIKEKEQIELDIFNYIWTSFPLSKEDALAISRLFDNISYSSVFKEFIVSAILLSLLEYYDDNLIVILLNQYNSDCKSLSIKSLVASVWALNLYSERINSNVKNAIASVSETPSFYDDVKSVLFHIVKSKNTDRISQKMEDALMARIKKISPDILSKFTSDASLSDLNDFDSNPEWNKILENDEFASKMEEISKLQLEGGDVFANTFSHLKSFPFFEPLPNWFMPFSPSHSLVIQSLSDKEIKLIDVMLTSKFLCDSDKYSFVASLSSVPHSQREMMMSQLNEQNNALNEMTAGDLKSVNDLTTESIINNYIQNLYRFFKFNRYKKDFIDIFGAHFSIVDLHKCLQFHDLGGLLILVGEYHLKNELYSDAVGYLTSVDSATINHKPVLLQKLGFCYQNLGEYTKAIDCYKKFDLFSERDLWNMKHLAICYKALNQYDKALFHYSEADSIEPDNINTVLNIGHCLLELGEIDKAVKQYYKADYLAPSSLRAWRPLSWCLLLLGDYTQSESYFEKIISSKPVAVDYLNYAHLKFAKNEIPQAITLYKKAISLYGSNMDKFEEAYLADTISMLKMGINECDIHILLDSLYNSDF